MDKELFSRKGTKIIFGVVHKLREGFFFLKFKQLTPLFQGSLIMPPPTLSYEIFILNLCRVYSKVTQDDLGAGLGDNILMFLL